MLKVHLALLLIVLAGVSCDRPFKDETGRYVLSTTTASSYIQALAVCKTYGYSLATERTTEDTAALEEAIKTSDDETATKVSYYLGGLLSVTSLGKKWLWLESAEIISYEHWSDENSSEECLVRKASSDGGLWTSNDCSQSLHFICESVQ